MKRADRIRAREDQARTKVLERLDAAIAEAKRLAAVMRDLQTSDPPGDLRTLLKPGVTPTSNRDETVH